MFFTAKNVKKTFVHQKVSSGACFQSGSAAERGDSPQHVVRDAADLIATLVTHHRANNTALSAVIEVTLETVRHSHSGTSSFRAQKGISSSRDTFSSYSVILV